MSCKIQRCVIMTVLRYLKYMAYYYFYDTSLNLSQDCPQTIHMIFWGWFNCNYEKNKQTRQQQQQNIKPES